MSSKVPSRLRCGHARRDITPAAECSLLGYDQRLEFFPEPGHAGVHDPLFADVLVVESGDCRAAVVSLDLCILENSCANLLRGVVGAAADLPPENVILACNHTHSGPYPWKPEWTVREPVPHPLHDEASQRYADFLEDRLAVCAADAAHKLFPSVVGLRSARLAMGYTRRVPAGDGTVGMAWDRREWDGPEPAPCDDDAFQMLEIVCEGGPGILLWNAAAHAVVLGKRSNVVSADWPGAVRSRIEAKHAGMRAMFLHGAGGDVHPWLATGSDEADLDAVAAPAVAAVLAILSSDRTVGSGGEVRCVSASGLTALRLGPARLLAVPCEIFGRTGAALRREFPDLLLATTANGWEGYWPPAECFPEGGHEVSAALDMGRRPGDCGLLVAEGHRLLLSL